MIIEIIDDALIEHNFVKETDNEETRFYVREIGPAIRFVILHKLYDLTTPKELNAKINRSVPAVFANNPSFKKNCDLICVLHLSHLSEFKSREEEIFAIEEDPHFFKKYVLYYSDAEENLLEGQSYSELKASVADKYLFDKYKENPLAATQYSVAAKIFIKLPFLELPFVKRELVPLRLQAEGAVEEAGLLNTYKNIQKLSSTNVDELIREMVTNELENF